MNKLVITVSFLVLLLNAVFAADYLMNEPDSAYIFSYTLKEKSGGDGLRFAWSIDKQNWHPIDHKFLSCDYGRWGSEKKMYSPFLFADRKGQWYCIWTLNSDTGVFAHAASGDLIHWGRQSYPAVSKDNNCIELQAAYDKTMEQYIISWVSTNNSDSSCYYVTTRDFKNYSSAQAFDEANRLDKREDILLSNVSESGIVHKVSWDVIDKLIETKQIVDYKNFLSNQTARDDSIQFAGLKPFDAIITIEGAEKKDISDMLIGVFFEDINYAADGGLYAELIQNRDFEYTPGDREGKDTTWNSYKCWSLNGSGTAFAVDTLSPIHANNKHYAVLEIDKAGAGLVNEGYDGIPVEEGGKYNFSIFAKNQDDIDKSLLINLTGKDGEVYGSSTVNINSSEWQKFETVITAGKTVQDARLEIIPQTKGAVALDMISFFPEETFKGHKNGLRIDLAQAVADIHPCFVRFPGGCVAHGDGLNNIYRWKNTIGPLESRKPQRNIWGYHQSAGLGFFEYFQFCEDIGAEPVPIVAAGVPCQNSVGGQQGGIPMSEMDEYVQDVLDLIEWANGDVNTVWGKKRAEAGHPEPFNLKYIGIGNEDLISDIFEERYTMICNAVQEKHPEITIIGTVGPFSEGTDYVEGWCLASKLNIPIVDEHYYQAPGWFINNQDFYDKYDRSKSKVYLGEYASWGNTFFNALAEAIYLNSIERNGDIVTMASYAPLLAREGHTQWRTDLIYFNGTEVKPTVNYYVQQLYGQNSGDQYLTCYISIQDAKDEITKRVSVSAVRDSKSGDVVIKLVNLLPVDVNTKLNLNDINLAGCTIIASVLQGKPDSKIPQPHYSSLEITNDSEYKMPAYSLTVIKISKTGEKK